MTVSLDNVLEVDEAYRLDLSGLALHWDEADEEYFTWAEPDGRPTILTSREATFVRQSLRALEAGLPARRRALPHVLARMIPLPCDGTYVDLIPACAWFARWGLRPGVRISASSYGHRVFFAEYEARTEAGSDALMTLIDDDPRRFEAASFFAICHESHAEYEPRVRSTTSFSQELVAVTRGLMDTDVFERWLRLLNPLQFEEFVAEAFIKHGYDVARTPITGDDGVDLWVARKDGHHGLYAVQCKHTAADRRVGVSVVREMVGTMALTGASGGIVVTSARFTRGARRASESSLLKTQLRLADCTRLWEYFFREIDPLVP